METGKSVARLRFVRDLLGRTASEGEGDAEGGFTLIELMVVLLIMGILLAIAIPTFLSVTGGAKKTSAQSNLTDVMTSATAIYTGNNATFPDTTVLSSTLTKTQNTIKFLTGAITGTSTKGKNTVSIYSNSSDLAVFAALDGDTVCWVAADNQSTTTTGTVPNGDRFYGATVGTAPSGTTAPHIAVGDCTAKYFVTGSGKVAKADWRANFSTISSPKT